MKFDKNGNMKIEKIDTGICTLCYNDIKCAVKYDRYNNGTIFFKGMFYHLFKDDTKFFVTINGKDVVIIFN